MISQKNTRITGGLVGTSKKNSKKQQRNHQGLQFSSPLSSETDELLQEQAVTKIQAVFKGFQVRKKMSNSYLNDSFNLSNDSINPNKLHSNQLLIEDNINNNDNHGWKQALSMQQEINLLRKINEDLRVRLEATSWQLMEKVIHQYQHYHLSCSDHEQKASLNQIQGNLENGSVQSPSSLFNQIECLRLNLETLIQQTPYNNSNNITKSGMAPLHGISNSNISNNMNTTNSSTNLSNASIGTITSANFRLTQKHSLFATTNGTTTSSSNSNGSTTRSSSSSNLLASKDRYSSQDDDILDLKNLIQNYDDTAVEEEHLSQTFNIGQYAEIAAAAEPPIAMYISEPEDLCCPLIIRSDSISPSKSIWTPLNDEISPIKSGGLDPLPLYSFTPVRTSSSVKLNNLQHQFAQYTHNGLEQSKPIWSESDNSDLGSSSCVPTPPMANTLMEEYRIESDKLRIQSFEKSQRLSVQALVEKIVKTNDQPASLLLQQKIKDGPESNRAMIIDCVIDQCVPIMKNRFGNFLMQRCLEFGTPEQLSSIMNAMLGQIHVLACDRFGCHVVQKALEVVEEPLKIKILHHLAPNIHESITNKFSCHVWQRMFELKWSTPEHSSSLEQAIQSMQGFWTGVANDENGSLVVQCIFENCEETLRLRIMNEIKQSMVDIARGQWGNWVVQHILENGDPVDKAFIFETVQKNMFILSTDQFSSKVVEKALKFAPPNELHAMVQSVITTDNATRTSLLLEMMINQYANYVVQHILNNAEPSQQSQCVFLMLPHIPILRSSKYGQRVAVLVERLARHFGMISPYLYAPGAVSPNGNTIHSPSTNNIKFKIVS